MTSSNTSEGETKMATAIYEVTVKLPNGNNGKIRIEASSHGNAKAMAEAQYGKGSVMNVSYKG
jgi:hypothetical protein